MIPANSSNDFKAFVSAFIASVKSGKRYDFRMYQNVIIPQRFLSPSPLSNLTEVDSIDYEPPYTVPYSATQLYKLGTSVRTSDFFMDLQYALMNGKDVESVQFEWLVRIKPFSILNAKLKDVIPAPVFTTQPQGGQINEGSTMTLNVVATNADSYQWQKDGSNISGASSSTLSKTNIKPSDAGSYACVATGVGGATTSNSAIVTILAKPVITTQPQGSTITEGEPLELSVVATGATSYQWKLNGVNASGDSTSATLSYSSTTSAQAGDYTVDCINTAGTVTSSAATVVINPVTPEQENE